MSGHFSTLARRTITTMLPDMDVYVTDWNSARDIPLSAGKFDLDDYASSRPTTTDAEFEVPRPL